MVGSVVLLSYALAFVMPSNMGRIALLMPIVAAMPGVPALKRDAPVVWPGAGGGVRDLPAVCHHPARQRPESGDERRGGGSYGIHLNYLPYLLLHTPVLGWLKGCADRLICWLFPGKPHPPRDMTPLPPMSRDEKRLAWLLGGS
jgi:hypothetical protein